MMSSGSHGRRFDTGLMTLRIRLFRSGSGCILYPLMLAWAVTIHKGKGKTLEKVRVDLGSGAFV